MLYFHFYLSQNILKIFISSLMHWWLSIMLFHLHIFVNFPVVFLWWISSFMLLWLEKMLDMILIFLNLFRLVSWPNMWSVLDNIPCMLEKNAYSVAFEWNALYMSVKSIWLNVSFKSSVSLFFVYMTYPLLKVEYWDPLWLLYCCLFFSLDLLIFALFI